MTPWYKSKQFWFNALTIVVAVAASFDFDTFEPDPRTMVIAQLLVAVVNVALRFAFPSAPPPARLEQSKSGVWDLHLPTTTYRTTNITAADTFATTAIAAAIALALTG